MSNIYTSADQLIGKTPLLQLCHLERKEQLSAKLVQLVLVNQVVRGSTGVIMVDDKNIQFFPHGSEAASARRPLIYEKK